MTLRNHAREALWAPCYGGRGRVDARSQEVLRLGPSGSYCRCKSSVFKKVEYIYIERERERERNKRKEIEIG